MNEDFEQQLQAAKRWASRARDAGWLAEADIAPLASLEHLSPASLFEPGTHRPLVVAFFGGTGVGKSTLLNRLAGQSIARVGVERPTSREVSIYLHESLSLRQLPAGFPVDRVRIARHADENRRQVLWIDMPDIDSTETGNRRLVADWLPHIDVLIYVVSPERYRDDKGWRMLREHVREHAWLFVMNQWDRGQEVQCSDFAKLLGQGGFHTPLIFRTDCRDESERQGSDEFGSLQSAIQSLADSHLIEQLEQRALDARREELQAIVGACLSRFGSDADLQGLREQWEQIWGETGNELLKGMEWPVAEVAQAFVRHDANPLRRSIKLEKPEKGAVAEKPAQPSILWDDWAQMQLRDGLDRLLVEAGDRHLPIAPLKAGLAGVAQGAHKLMTSEAQRALRLALARPGNATQRFLLKLIGLFSVLLPLTALGWVSWQAVTAYYDSALKHTGFLGADFAVHSALIIAIAWLLPFFLNLQLKPSTERAALRGLRNGINAGLARIRVLVDEQLAEYEGSRLARIEEGQKFLTPPSKEEISGQGVLGRMVPRARDSVRSECPSPKGI